MDYLAQRLQQLRRQKGLSQENLAEQLGVSRQAVGKWESGATVPELEKLLELCRLFDTDLNDLLGLESRTEQSDSEQASHQPQGFTEEQMELLRQLIREGRQQAATSPQPVQKRRKWPFVLAAVVVLIGSISLSEWYGQLQYRLQNLQWQIGSTQQQIGSLDNAIGNIENNIKETLEQQASILTFAGAELTRVELAPQQFTCTLWALPKNRTEHTRVQFSLETNQGTKLLEAAWTGDRYAVEATMSWCQIKTVTAVVEEQGVLSSQVIKGAYMEPAAEALLNVTGWAFIDLWDDNGKLLVDSGVSIHRGDFCKGEPLSVQMWVEQDGKQLVSVPLYRNDEDGGSDGFWDYSSHGALQNPIEKKNQTLVLKTRVTDSLGCTYDLVAGILKLTWDGSNLLQMEHLSAGTEDWPVTVTLPGGNTVELTGIWKY